ncbi:MAG: hypothetical protein WCG83_00030 [Candidatus Peregrinibacteria bacterium]
MKKLLLTSPFLLLALATVAYAGSLSPTAPPSTPAATSYTLTNIYNRLTTNATATAGDHAFAPSGAPAASFKTLTQIYDAIPTITANLVKLGTTYLGINGTLTPNGGTAAVGDVLAGKTAHLTGDWNLDTGTMTDRDGDNVSTAQAAALGVNYLTAPAGYYDGDDRVSATDAQIAALDSDIAVGNIKSGTDIFGVSGTLSSGGGYPGTGWVANGSGNGSTALNSTNCAAASGWYWFADGNGDGDTTDPEDGICVQGTEQVGTSAGSWNGDDNISVRDNTYIPAYTCSGNFPSGTVATYSGTNAAGTADAIWDAGDCAFCQADCYDGKKDLPGQGTYTSPNVAASGGVQGPITPEVLKNWKGTRLPTSMDFFGYCGYKNGYSAGADNYETSCSSDTTHGDWGQMVGRTDKCIDLSNNGNNEWLSEQYNNTSARVAMNYACSLFHSYNVNNDYRFRAVFRP